MSARARMWMVIAVLAIVGAALGGVVWLESIRPVRVTIRATPDSATIRVGEHEGTGHLEVELPPGPVHIDVRAPGYSPWSLDTALAPRGDLELEPKLRPIKRPTPLPLPGSR